MRVAGIDDGYFPLSYKGRRGKTILVSVVLDGFRITNVDFRYVEVDGIDGQAAYEELSKGEINIIDGVTVAGFNYVRPGPNDIIFYAYRPDVKRINNALEKHFADGRERHILETLNNLREIPTKRGTVYVFSYLPEKLVREIIEKYQVYSKVPYPLYIASEIAKKLSRFLITRLNFL